MVGSGGRECLGQGVVRVRGWWGMGGGGHRSRGWWGQGIGVVGLGVFRWGF